MDGSTIAVDTTALARMVEVARDCYAAHTGGGAAIAVIAAMLMAETDDGDVYAGLIAHIGELVMEETDDRWIAATLIDAVRATGRR